MSIKTMAYDTIKLDLADTVATITLNRPDKLNSFTSAMHTEIAAALDEVAASSARVLVITGEGRAFCAGQDLGERDFEINEDFDAGVSLEKYYNPLIKRLHDLPMPVLCAVNGVAAGAGANVALACDIVIAARSASFIQAFVKIGLVPDAGGSWSLVRKVGIARAMGLAMLGEPLGAEKAEDWGLIWKAVDDDKLTETVSVMANHLATQPTAALASIKKAIRAAASNDMPTQLEMERALQSAASKTADFREGIAAFNEKRPPRFQGN